MNAEAFRTLYEREFDYVWHNLRRLGIPPRDLPDVTQDVFVAVFRAIDGYDSTRRLRPWLFGVLFNVASDHRRLARNAREILEDAPGGAADPGPYPDQQAAEREEWAIVERALATLDLGHRAVLVMHDFAGHAVQEVACELGIPVKTVYSRLRTARARVTFAARHLQAVRASR